MPRRKKPPSRSRSWEALCSRCAIPFELLDIFVGAWAATFLVEMDEKRLMPTEWTMADEDRYPADRGTELRRKASFIAPDGSKHLKSVLSLDDYQRYPGRAQFLPDTERLIMDICTDFVLRGFGESRIMTFQARIQAAVLLLKGVKDGHLDPGLWSAERNVVPPSRVWSAEQQAVLDAIHCWTLLEDATEMLTADRVLHVTGGPGTGKTEVVLAAAIDADQTGCRVVLAGRSDSW